MQYYTKFVLSNMIASNVNWSYGFDLELRAIMYLVIGYKVGRPVKLGDFSFNLSSSSPLLVIFIFNHLKSNDELR